MVVPMDFFSCQPIVEDTANLFQKENKILLFIKDSPSLNDLGEIRGHGFKSSLRNLLKSLFYK